MSRPGTVVLVGAGLASARAAETLRDEGFEDAIVLVGREIDLPYARPPLSKGYLAGTVNRTSFQVHDAGWYSDHNVEVITGRAVEEIELHARHVRLDNGRRIEFHKLLLATGSRPRHLTVPGSDLDGVHYLRTAGDSDALRRALTSGDRRVVVIGGGWIGLEVASTARKFGNDVTIVEPQRTVLLGSLGEEVGNIFADLHRRNGTQVLIRARVRSLDGEEGKVTSVELESGIRVPADVVVVGIGVEPEVQLAANAGVDVLNGVLVDQSLRSSHPDVYAAGDIANAYHPFFRTHVRVEHWATALHTGPAAARAMLGQPVSYDRLPYFFTDQFDFGMEYVGYVGPDGYDKVVVRGDTAASELMAFWLRGGRVVAGMHVNQWGTTDAIEELIRSRRVTDANDLADVSRSLGGPSESVQAASGHTSTD